MENPKFQILPSKNSQYYFVLKSGNGETILKASEMYESKQGCKKGIFSVKDNAPYDPRYTRSDAYMHYTFNLKAENGRILGNSEIYTSSAARENGIAAVKRDAPEAPIEDLA